MGFGFLEVGYKQHDFLMWCGLSEEKKATV